MSAVTKRRTRDLSKAITLRPRDIFDLYGITPSVLCRIANHADSTKRLPSTLIPGRAGRKGVRLVKHDDLRAYLDQHAAKPEAAA